MMMSSMSIRRAQVPALIAPQEAFVMEVDSLSRKRAFGGVKDSR